MASWSSSLVTDRPSFFGRGRSAPRDVLRDCSDLGAERIELVLQFDQPVFGRVQPLQFRRRLVHPDQHGIDILAVPPGQRAQGGLPGQHLLQPGRVGVQIDQVAGKFRRDVDQGHRSLLQLTREVGQPRVRRTRQIVPGRLDQRDRSGRIGKIVGSGERGDGHLSGRPQPVGVLQPPGLGDQLDVLCGKGRDGSDLGKAEPEQLFPLRPLACPGPSIGEVGRQALPFGAQRPVLAQFVVQAGESVEHRPLLSRPQ